MPTLRAMPKIVIAKSKLRPWGRAWLRSDPEKPKDKPEYFVKKDAMGFGKVFDEAVGAALATMMGGVPVVRPGRNDLSPSEADCVEVGDCRIIGGIRPQNYDVCYRPDGVRFVFDGKTLNEANSVQKNYQNMINDLGTEATNVHTRFPYAIMAFLVVIPSPTLVSPQREALTGCLERLSERLSPIENPHNAEVISLVVWNPEDGSVSADWPPQDSCLRLEGFSSLVERVYLDRYKGLPPHV